MHQLLLAETTYPRLQTKLDSLDDIQYVTIGDSGTLFSDGKELPIDDFKLSMFIMDADLCGKNQLKIVIDMMEKSESFEYVHTAAASLDNPVFRMIANKAKVFCNSDAQSPAIAEFIMASVMNRWHRFDVRIERQREKHWDVFELKQVLGSNWLVIGFGNIGQLVAKHAHGFGASVTGIRRNIQLNEFTDQICTLDALPDLIPQADVIVLSCPLNLETEGLVDSKFLKSMKNDAMLVNIGRGGLVDETALVNALDNDELDFAILDVFQTEPLPEDSPIWRNSKIQVTPHASFLGSKTPERYDEIVH